MPRSNALVALLCLPLFACQASAPTGGDVCAQAAAHYGSCTGKSYPAPFECAGADLSLAEDVLATSCDELGGGGKKDDGLVAAKCFFLDVTEHSICLAAGYAEELREEGFCRVPRTFRAGIPEGGPCCNPANCAELNDAGERLSCDTDSFLGLSGTCAPVRGLGASCDGDWICDDGLTCRYPAPGECDGADCRDEQCRPPLSVGSACQDRAGSGCPRGTVCIGDASSRDGVCEAPIGEGGACEPGDCEDGLDCDPIDGICTATAHCDPMGILPCGIDGTCWPVGDEWRCAPERDTCETCYVDDDCGAPFNRCHPTAQVCYDPADDLATQCPDA